MGEDFIEINIRTVFGRKKSNHKGPFIPMKDVFLIHDRCWNTVLGHCQLDEVDLDSIYEAFEGMPVTKSATLAFCFPPQRLLFFFSSLLTI